MTKSTAEIIPSIGDQADFYDAWNTRNRDTTFAAMPEEIRIRGEEILRQIAALNVSGPAILEVGCGTGWLTERLADVGRVMSIDLSPAAVEIAKARKLDACFIAGDFLSHDFGDANFDIVICVETLFYVQDQDQFVRKLATLTKPGGWLFVSTVNKFVYDRSSDIEPPEKGQIRIWLTRRQTAALLGRHFRVRSAYTIGPRGDMGVLQLVNSYKLNTLLEYIIPRKTLTAIKEKAGLGGGVIYVARRF